MNRWPGPDEYRALDIAPVENVWSRPGMGGRLKVDACGQLSGLHHLPAAHHKVAGISLLESFPGEVSTPIGLTIRKPKARKADKSNLEFHYFEGLDHSLGLGRYFAGGGELPEGHKAIFDFIQTRLGSR